MAGSSLRENRRFLSLPVLMELACIPRGNRARLACLAFFRGVSVALEAGLLVSEITKWHILKWYQEARGKLSLEACLRNLDLRDFACTLLTAIVGNNSAIFAQIGDGAIIVGEDAGYKTVFWPQNGEYANTTFFLTGADYEERLAVRTFDHRINELALLTDGLQPLALHYATKSVHNPFFAPMFQSLRQSAKSEELEDSLNEFLNSKAVNARTDDDKTLILATRRSPSNDSI